MNRTDQNAKARAYKKGLWAEAHSAIWLVFKGYWPIARRFKTPQGEIDLICRNRNTLVYVEVKYRAALEDGLYALRPAQLQRVRRAADIFLKQNPHLAALDQRIDLIVLAAKKTPVHVKNLV